MATTPDKGAADGGDRHGSEGTYRFGGDTSELIAATHPPESPALTGGDGAGAGTASALLGIGAGRTSGLRSEPGPSGLDGVPWRYDDGVKWLSAGLHRQPWGILVALVFGWTGVWLALWGAVAGAILGILLALGVIDSTGLGHDLLNLGAGQAVTAVGVLSGIFVGAAGGFVAVLRPILFDKPWQPPVAIGSGIVLAFILLVLVASYERFTLRLRGYRRLSRDEVRRVAPVVKGVADAMELDGLPRFAMADQVIPNAWTHMRTIVITTGLLQTLNDDELSGVMAHELGHWRAGDTVGMQMVWACAWPLALSMNVGLWLAGIRTSGGGNEGAGRYRGIIVLFGWLIAWPAWVVTTLVIGPVVASHQRRYEYEADAVAKELGYAAPLSSALKKMSAFEGGRTGWEYAMRRTHPPTELRLEALQSPRPDDEQYQEDELGLPHWGEVRRMFSAGTTAAGRAVSAVPMARDRVL